MESLFTETGRWFLGQGVLGIFLGLALWFIWHERGRLHEAQANCQDQVRAANAERFADYRTVIETIQDNKQAVADLTESRKATADAIASAAEAQRLMSGELGRLAQTLQHLVNTVADCKTENQQQKIEFARLREIIVEFLRQRGQRGGDTG